MIDISDLDTAEVLLYLYRFAKSNAKKRQAVHYKALMGNWLTSKQSQREKAQILVKKGHLYFYEVNLGLDSRILCVNLSRGSFDPFQYNQLHGTVLQPERAEAAIKALRAKLKAKQENSLDALIDDFTSLENTSKIKLKNGIEVYERDYFKTIAVLDRLWAPEDTKEWLNSIFFMELVKKCRNPEYASPYQTTSLIQFSNGLLNGKGNILSEDIRQIILAATEGDGLNIHRVNPLGNRRAQRRSSV